MLRNVYPLSISRFLVYGALMGSVGAVWGRIPFPALVVFLLSYGLGLALDRKGVGIPGLRPRILVPLVLLGVFISLMGMNQDNFFDRALGILIIIIGAKLVSPKKGRDMLQLFLLNFLVVGAAAITRWGLDFAILVLVEAFLSISGLVFVYGASEEQDIALSQAGKLFRWSGLLTLGLIPAAALFFLIIPRPTWTLLAWGGGAVAKTGFSDRVSPGAVEEIQSDPSPAFRIRWIRGRPPERPLWRAIVYGSYQEGGWEKGADEVIDFPEGSGETVEYEIVLEPTESRHLPVLGVPLGVWSKHIKPALTTGYTLKAPKAIQNRTLYRVRSDPVSDIPGHGPLPYDEHLPPRLRGGLMTLADRVARETDLETAKAAEAFLQKGFQYDLSPGKAPGDPVLHFLYESKRGHCEYFASSMVLLLRSLGIPARIVAGYRGGEWNDLGQYLLVRQSHAHTWVEVWIRGRGWVPFDPTPWAAVAKGPFLKGSLSQLIDFLRLKWYYWVIDYDLGRQMDLARNTASLFSAIREGKGKMAVDLKGTGFKAVWLIVGAAGLILAYRWTARHLRNRPKTRGERFVRILGRYGYHKAPGETLREFIGRIAAQDAPLGRQGLVFVEQYYRVEYGRQGKAEVLDRLLMALNKGRWND